MAAPTLLGDLTWTDLDGRAPVLIVPVGSVEQHGPHLPLDTDTRIAAAIAQQVASVRDDLVIAPPIAIGASGEHAGFPGTLSIGTDALTTVLIEVGRSADRFGGVVFVNGHGGNLSALTAAASLLRDEGRRALAWSPRIPGGDAHAGRSETSLLLAIDPSCVRLDSMVVGRTDPVVELIDELRDGGVRAVSDNGVLGDPTAASAAHGRELLDALVSDLGTAIDGAFP